MNLYKKLLSGFLLSVCILLFGGCTDDSNYQNSTPSVFDENRSVIEQPEMMQDSAESVLKQFDTSKSVEIKPVEDNSYNYSPSVDYYTNVDGYKVQSPTYYSSAPAGATAQCEDGTYSFSKHRSGTCSHHGGVASWL